METADEIDRDMKAGTPNDDGARIQRGAYFLELSLDWIVLRASENVHHLLRESHVTLIDEPFGKFVQAQALHDLRNLFSRLSGTTGVARAYAVRLTDDNDLVDIAFQLAGGRVLLEAIPSGGCFGECFGTVAGLISGLTSPRGQALLDGGARRMRALTGYDRVTLIYGDRRAESSRGTFAAPSSMADGHPAIIGDASGEGVAIFPRRSHETSASEALLRSCDAGIADTCANEGVRASLRLPFSVDGISGEFRCDHRAPRLPSFELHAAAELFAQLFAMRLEIDALKAR
jgi:light-regulated signal transduction histidine kinase (bacteriophytochrome)